MTFLLWQETVSSPGRLFVTKNIAIVANTFRSFQLRAGDWLPASSSIKRSAFYFYCSLYFSLSHAGHVLLVMSVQRSPWAFYSSNVWIVSKVYLSNRKCNISDVQTQEAKVMILSTIPSFLKPWYGSNPVAAMYKVHGGSRPIMILNVLEPNAFDTVWFPNPFSAATLFVM